MLLGGCSKEHTDDTLPTPSKQDHRLVFGVESVETRGGSTTTATIQEFGVFCFDTGQSKWEAIQTSATPNKMFDQQVVRSGNTWSYDPPVYWDNYENKLHSFFAYSPLAKGMLADQSDGNNLKLISTQATAGIPELKFELLDELLNQIDLLVAKEHLNLKPQDAVLMNFKHALSRIGFKAFSDAAGTYIDKIEIIGIPYKGTLKMTSPAVWTIDADTKNFTFNYGNGVPILATEDNPADISAPGRYLMSVPNDWTGNVTAKARVYFRQNGKAMDKEFLIGAMGEAWAQNGSVTYVLDLNGVPNNDLIVEKVIIDEWKMGSITDADVGLQGENYWLRFDANGGGANMPSDMELESGTLYKIPNVAPVKPNVTFDGWNTAQNGSGTTYKIGERVPINDADITLYAQWI